jgi:hypothetical protein
MAGQGVKVKVGGKVIQKKQSNVKIEAKPKRCTTMLPRFTLSTSAPQTGYRNTLPLSKYAAEVLAFDSLSPNRRSKMFLSMKNFSLMNRGLRYRTYVERWIKGCHIEPQRTFSAIYLSEMITGLP